jgi:hypothetical protein
VATALAPDQLESSATSVVHTAAEPAPDTPAVAPDAGVSSSLVAEALLHYENAQKAMKDGDWALYGDEMKKVGDLLQQMQDTKGAK